MFKRFRCKVPMNLQKFAEGGSGDGGGAGGSAANGGTPPAGVQQTPQFDYDKLASLIAGTQTVTGIINGKFKLCRTVESGTPRDPDAGNPDLSVCDQQCKMAGCKNIPFYTDEYIWL